jgi:hypothetical protein
MKRIVGVYEGLSSFSDEENVSFQSIPLKSRQLGEKEVIKNKCTLLLFAYAFIIRTAESQSD